MKKQSVLINKSLMDEVKAEYNALYTKPSSIKFALNCVGGLVRLENGLILRLGKVTLDRSFCFGYGMGTSFDEACQQARDARTWDYFHNANMRNFDHKYKWAFEGNRENYFFSRDTNWQTKQTCNVCSILPKRVYDMETEFGAPTEADWTAIKAEVTRMRTAFEKRLQTYWKKYKDTKLRTWTYDYMD